MNLAVVQVKLRYLYCEVTHSYRYCEVTHSSVLKPDTYNVWAIFVKLIVDRGKPTDISHFRKPCWNTITRKKLTDSGMRRGSAWRRKPVCWGAQRPSSADARHKDRRCPVLERKETTIKLFYKRIDFTRPFSGKFNARALFPADGSAAMRQLADSWARKSDR